MMVCMSIALSLTFIMLVFYTSLGTVNSTSNSGRFGVAFKSIFDVLVANFASAVKPVTGSLLISLFVALAVMNLLGNVPLMNIPSMYYFFSLSVSLSLWVAVIIVVSFTQLKDFLAHMLPYGSPIALMLFLPLVEIFSHIIRPFTLMIRLSTNLSSGHIMMFMFSFFSVSSDVLTFVISGVLVCLLVLELCISVLQAYIFASLVSMYLSETH